jgi:predicted DNA-binding transcriptional regulator YafY
VAQRRDADLPTAAENALAKIAAVLPVPLTASLTNAGLFSGSSRAQVPDVIDPAVIRSAIRGQRKLRIAYQDESGQATQRVVWPIALVYFEAVRLVVAWCELRIAFRHFRSDRISELVVLDEPYPKSRQALIRAWQEDDRGDRAAAKRAREQARAAARN